jgi:hypothetical protein
MEDRRKIKEAAESEMKQKEEIHPIKNKRYDERC